MDLADVLDIGGRRAAVDLKGALAVAELGLGADDPGVVVAEDARILLVAGGIARYLAELEMIAGIGRLEQHDAVACVEVLLYACKGFCSLAALLADAGHDAHALRLDKDPALFAFPAAHDVSEGVIGAAEPCAVPAAVEHRALHGADGLLDLLRLGGKTDVAADLRPGAAVFDEHAGDEHALGYRAFARPGDLEALARLGGEAVEVQTVVPVRPADQRQTMRPEMRAGIAEAAPQMLEQRTGKRGIVVKIDELAQDAPVAGLTQIGVRPGDQPQRVVVEAAAHGEVAFFRQRLILVIGAAVRELGGCDVEDALARTLRDHVHKAQQILARIAEAHPAPHAGLEIAGRAAHVEGDHALVLVPVPYVDHAVELFLAALHPVGAKQPLPVFPQRGKGGVKGLISGIARDHRAGAGFVHNAGRFPFFLLRIFDVAETEDDALALPGEQREIKLLGRDGLPAVGNAVRAAAAENGRGTGGGAVNADKGVARGVKGTARPVGPENGVMVAPLAVLGLVIDRAAIHLDLAGGVVALEVGAVVHRVPETEFEIRKRPHGFFSVAAVVQRHAHQKTVVPERDEQLLPGAEAVLPALDDRIAQPVAAAVTVKLRLYGLPAGVPDALAVPDIKMKALGIEGTVVVAIARQTAQARVAVKRIAAGRVGAERKEVLAAEIVDPGQRRARRRDDIFLSGIVKKTVFHM